VVPTERTEKDFREGNARRLFGATAELARGMDRVIVNLECALTEHTVGIRKCGPNIKAHPDTIKGYLALGVTDVMLANNHVFDFGVKGLRDTLATLEAAGLPYTGVGENDTDSRRLYYIEGEDGVRVGIVNAVEHEYTYALPNRPGANPFDPFLTMQDIRECRKNADRVIVIYHGGKEFCRYPSPRLYNACHEMVLCGADLVLTQHSHCIGCYEQFEGGHILYGQGNFNFAERVIYSNNESTFTGLLVEVEATKESFGVKFHPVRQTAWGCDLATGEVAEIIMREFEKRCASLTDGSWRRGWHEFCIDPARHYYSEPLSHPLETEEDIEIFAHYLDCEAHTDAWRELYPTWNATNEL